MSICIAAQKTPGAVEWTYLLLEPGNEFAGSITVGLQIQVFDFLANNPVRHRVNVIPRDFASQPVGF